MSTAHEKVRQQVNVLIDATLHAGVLLSGWQHWSALRIENCLSGGAVAKDFGKAFFLYVDMFYTKHDLCTHDLWELLSDGIVSEEYKKRARGAEKEVLLLETILNCQFGEGDFTLFLKRELATLIVGELSSTKAQMRELHISLIRWLTSYSGSVDNECIINYIAFTKEKLSTVGMRDTLPKSCALCSIRHVEDEPNIIVDLLFMLAAAAPASDQNLFTTVFPCIILNLSIDYLHTRKIGDVIKRQCLRLCSISAEREHGTFTIRRYHTLLTVILNGALSNAFPAWYFLRRMNDDDSARHSALQFFEDLPRACRTLGQSRDPERHKTLLAEHQINLLIMQIVAASDQHVFSQMHRQYKKMSAVMSDAETSTLRYINDLRAVDQHTLSEFGEGFIKHVVNFNWDGPVWGVMFSTIEKMFWQRELHQGDEAFDLQVRGIADGTVLRSLIFPSQTGAFIGHPELSEVAEGSTEVRQRLATDLYKLLVANKRNVTHLSDSNFKFPFLTILCREPQEVAMVISTERQWLSIESLLSTSEPEYHIGSRVVIAIPPHNVIKEAEILDKTQVGIFFEYIVQWEEAHSVSRVLGRDIVRSLGNGIGVKQTNRNSTVKEMQLQLCLTLFDNKEVEQSQSQLSTQQVLRSETEDVQTTASEEDFLPIEEELQSADEVCKLKTPPQKPITVSKAETTPTPAPVTPKDLSSTNGAAKVRKSSSTSTTNETLKRIKPDTLPDTTLLHSSKDSMRDSSCSKSVPRSQYDSLQRRYDRLLVDHENLTSERDQIKRDFEFLWRRHEDALKKLHQKKEE